MINFLKRYLHLRGDFSDEKRSKEFENKVNPLMANSLKFFFDTFIHFQGLFEVLTLHQMYPNDMSRVSNFSQFKINDIYVDDDSSEKIRYMIQLIILRLISPLESGDLYSKTNYEDGLRMTKFFALGLKESVLEDQLHNGLLNDISNLKNRDSYHFDGSLCDCIDYAINLDDSAALSDASYSLKKIFLCKDDFNTDAIFLMRKALLEDKRNSYLLNIEELNPKSRDLVFAIFCRCSYHCRYVWKKFYR